MSTPTPTHPKPATPPAAATPNADSGKPSNFLRQIIESDLAAGT